MFASLLALGLPTGELASQSSASADAAWKPRTDAPWTAQGYEAHRHRHTHVHAAGSQPRRHGSVTPVRAV